MTIPRQLAPTVGLSHDGFKFLEGNFEGPKGYDVGRMTMSRRGQLYIDDAGWCPEAGSIEYGDRGPSLHCRCRGLLVIRPKTYPLIPSKFPFKNSKPSCDSPTVDANCRGIVTADVLV